VDQPLARWLATRETLPAVWDHGIDALEIVFGFPISKYALAIVCAAGMVATTAIPRWRSHAPAWMFVTATQLVTRIAMGWMKTAFGRLRPNEWLAHGGGAATFFRDGASFPSGHVVLFAGVIVPLAIVAPRVGRPLFVIVALVAMARIAVMAHFLSDVTGAIAVVCALAWMCGAVIRPMRR
jgi:membrane-associated phospholipid phosphatase